MDLGGIRKMDFYHKLIDGMIISKETYKKVISLAEKILQEKRVDEKLVLII